MKPEHIPVEKYIHIRGLENLLYNINWPSPKINLEELKQGIISTCFPFH